MHASHLETLRPWRTATLVASGVAALELVLLVAAGIALFGNPLLDRLRGPAAPAARSKAASPAVPRPVPTVERAPRLARSETSILVLNGNGVAGSAGLAADRARSLGYLIGGVDNATRSTYPRSIVLYRPGRRAEGRRLARDLNVRTVGPLDGLTPAQLLGAHVALIVGR